MIQLTVSISLGISLLLFHLFGLLADLYFTRYYMMFLSLRTLAVTVMVAVVLSTLQIGLFSVFLNMHVPYFVLCIEYTAVVVVAISSIGLLKANTI